MKHIHFILLAALCLCTSSTLASNYEKRGNAVTIHLTNPDAKSAKLVQLEVVSDKIIRVRATPEEQFPTKTSLMIVPQHSKAKYNVTETDGNVIVKTSAAHVFVQAMCSHQRGRQP